MTPRVRTRSGPVPVLRSERPRPPLSAAVLDLRIAASHETANRLDDACRRLNAMSKSAPLWTQDRLGEWLINAGLDELLPKLLEKNNVG